MSYQGPLSSAPLWKSAVGSLAAAGVILATGLLYDGSNEVVQMQALVDNASAIGSALSPSSRVVIKGDRSKSVVCDGLIPKNNVELQDFILSYTGTDAGAQGIITNRTAKVPVDNFHVRFCEFRGDGQTAGTLSDRRGAIAIYYGSNIAVEWCKIHDFSDHGVTLVDTSRFRLLYNDVWNVCNVNAGNGLHVYMQGPGANADGTYSCKGEIGSNNIDNCFTAPICIGCSRDVTTNYNPFDVTVSGNVCRATYGFACIALEWGRIGAVGSTSDGSFIQKIKIWGNFGYQTGSDANAYAFAASDNNGGSGPQGTNPLGIAFVEVFNNTWESSVNGLMIQGSYCDISGGSVKITGGTGVGIIHTASHTGHTPTFTTIRDIRVLMPVNGGYGILIEDVDRPKTINTEVIYATGSTGAVTGYGYRLLRVSKPRARYDEVHNAPGTAFFVDTCTLISMIGLQALNPSETALNAGDYFRVTGCGRGNRNAQGPVNVFENCQGDEDRASLLAQSLFNSVTGNLSLRSIRNRGRTGSNLIHNGTWEEVHQSVVDYTGAPAPVASVSAPATGAALTNADRFPSVLVLSVSGGTITATAHKKAATGTAIEYVNGSATMVVIPQWRRLDTITPVYTGTLTITQLPFAG